jgi:hypothetical protein
MFKRLLRRVAPATKSESREMYAHTLNRMHEHMAATHKVIEQNNLLLGTQLSFTIAALPDRTDLWDTEFRVFSQNGEDGIIQYLVQRIGIKSKRFIEIGGSDYTECNTRFLLFNNEWTGLTIDGNPKYRQTIEGNQWYGWKYALKAVDAFVGTANINDIVKQAGFEGDIGLLSIDIDGIDYWLWDALTIVNPAIVVIEFNRNFGPERAVSVPNIENFDRTCLHASNRYWGASLKAMDNLARRKGYKFIGTNKSNRNAFFVRTELCDKLPTPTIEQRHSVPGWEATFDILHDLEFYDCDLKCSVKVGEKTLMANAQA